MTRGEQQYMAGYNAGRTLSLQTGSTDAGHGWLADHPGADPAFLAGFEWSLFDYDDANLGSAARGGTVAG
ncbi:hypothetical protein JCM18899A_14390 [Nocardioides sp. AN3]